ncbi:MAG: glycine--tRNA ligase [Chloroflexi bacterium]|nr:glycine--tRNA ligase [Chloroflexota bacterium]
MDKMVSLCKRRGFIFQSSEIYGGLSSCWDYGPLGVELKNNVKRAWWRSMVQERPDVVGLDAAILMHPQTWVASGHVAGFADPFVTCSGCGSHYRADQVWDAIWESAWWRSLLEAMRGEKTSLQLLQWTQSEGKKLAPNLALVVRPEVTLSWIADLHQAFHGVEADFKNFVGIVGARANGLPATPCPNCGGELSEPEPANLMLETFFGPVRATAQKIYLRPETAQGIFVNFQNVLTSTRLKLPFGIAQVGKAFRNEITPGNFVFRTREFEQMEMEFFVKPGTDKEWFDRWVQERFEWYKKLGMSADRLRLRQHGKDELAHYARDCFDVEYLFPMGWSELEGIANRGDFDLTQHARVSGKDLSYFDEETGQRFIPCVIEPSGGVDRAALAFLLDSYAEEPDKEGIRVVLRLHYDLAPIKVALLPLSRNEKLRPLSQEIYARLRRRFMAQFDDAQSIGRRYRRQDEIGTPLCVTIDFQSLEDSQVTIRERDSMRQVRVPLAALEETLERKLAGEPLEVLPAGASKWLGFEE